MAQLQVTADVLNVRAGAGTEFPVVVQLPRGARLEKVGEPAAGWQQVRLRALDGERTGFVSAKFVAPADQAIDTSDVVPGATAAADGTGGVVTGAPWYAAAVTQLGVEERPGPQENNPRILEYHAQTTLHASTDEVPWCSSFANWCMKQASIAGTASAAAVSWLDWGVPLDVPRPGCVAVLRRGPDPELGHVAFVARVRAREVDLLGGNQGNRVCIQTFPRDRVRGWRWPRGIAIPAAP